MSRSFVSNARNETSVKSPGGGGLKFFGKFWVGGKLGTLYTGGPIYAFNCILTWIF